MKKTQYTMLFVLLINALFVSAFTLQENATPNTAMVIFFIIALVLALLVILFGGVGKTKEVGEDDLTKIEGVGPKISSLLKENGYATFEKVARADVASLEKILDDAGLRMANSDTWPKQARLAADGKWEELQKLQDDLTGGRSE